MLTNLGLPSRVGRWQERRSSTRQAWENRAVVGGQIAEGKAENEEQRVRAWVMVSWVRLGVEGVEDEGVEQGYCRRPRSPSP